MDDSRVMKLLATLHPLQRERNSGDNFIPSFSLFSQPGILAQRIVMPMFMGYFST